jgi:hypothetical protein
MQTLTIEITNNDALKVLQNLQEKHFIKIRATHDLKSLVLPGEPLTTDEFKNFILNRENGSNMSLKEAKTKWVKKKKQLLQSVK